MSETNPAPTPPDATGADNQAAPRRALSPLQRVVEHGLSFAILTPAIGGFLVLLVTIAVLVPNEGLAVGLARALALSGGFWAAGYVVGLLPSLVTGLSVPALWRRFGPGRLLYACAAVINGVLCAAAFAILERTLAGLPTIGFIAMLATLASMFLTRKLREDYTGSR